MPAVNRSRLLALSEREFRESNTKPAAPPPPQKFRAMRLNLSRYDQSWDRKRGAAARLMGVLLRESDQELQERVCADAALTKTYTGAAEWLASEARYLRKVASLQETAASRLAAVIERCGEHPANA